MGLSSGLAALWGEAVATETRREGLGGSQLGKGCTLGRFQAFALCVPLLSLIIKEHICKGLRLS